jgi:DNA repair photolyase
LDVPDRTDLDSLEGQPLKPLDLWGRHRNQGPHHAIVERNRFKYKSLSSWAYNIAMGCNHACRFCYVPSTSTIKKGRELEHYGVTDPDEEWGDYVLLRAWDEKKFRHSVRRAQMLKSEELNADGNRAVIFCSTTDPYQTVAVPGDKPRQVLLNGLRRTLVKRALEVILEESDLNVRILTRSPLAKEDFALYRRFGHRLVFGMSLPTLNDDLRKLYEPKAPGVQARLRVLEEAKAAGLHVYVAMAPTSPECQEDDLRRTLTAIKALEPITIFHEPINLRAENFARIATHAAKLGVKFNQRPLLKENWAAYALWQLRAVESIASDLGVGRRLHLWPDKDLGKRHVWAQAMRSVNLPSNDRDFAEYLKWLKGWWNRISEWPKAPE